MSASDTTSNNLSLFGSLYARLASILVLILLTMAFVYGFITFSVTHNYLQEITQKFNHDLAKNLVGERDIVVNGKINTTALKQTFHDYMTVNPNIEIYLLDLQGKILSYSADPGKVQREFVTLGPVEAFFQGKLLPGDDPRSFTTRKAFSVTYVPTKENPEGYLYVVLRGEEFDQINQALQDNYFIQYSLLSLLISLSIGLLLGLFLFYTITRRVRNLSIAMNNFTRNGFCTYSEPKSVDKKYKDEISQLTNSFDVMAEHTITQMRKLEEQDKLRRDLVANISHDLRTPLASMLGYLEILMIKGDSLDADERKKYLKIVSQHGKRLNHLINDLFELARFDAREITPELEVFNFSEFIYDVAKKFQNKAERAGIDLQLHCSQESVSVKADIALIERVMDNLLGNAFNHTKAGDAISIIVTQIKDESGTNEMHIQIKDSGSGISENDLPKIFDRFYQARNKHRKGKHAGLGLAIVKQIVALHKHQISVQSKIGEGTQFTFSLAVEPDS